LSNSNHIGNNTKGLSQLKENGGKHRAYKNAPINNEKTLKIALPQNLKIIVSYSFISIARGQRRLIKKGGIRLMM